MIEKIVADSANDAFIQLFGLLRLYGIESAPRGHRIKEIINANIVIKNPRDRVIMCPERRMDMAYAFGELAWYLSGRNDKDTMCYYSKFMENMSDDGKTLNSAYGYRIFGNHKKIGFDQFQNVIDLFKKDKDTRQAIIHLHTPNDEPTKDEVCTLSLQFILRNNKLDMITTMRSNDLVLGFTYDVFSFTMLQEIMANELGAELGTYYHNVGSMHYYEDDYYNNNDVVKKRTIVESVPMAPFSFKLYDLRDLLTSYEEFVRTKTQSLMNASVEERLQFIENIMKAIDCQQSELLILFEAAFLLKSMKKLKEFGKQTELLNMVGEKRESLVDMLLLNAKYKRDNSKIIVEGVDGAGKTTMIKQINDENKFVRHYGVPSFDFKYFKEYILSLSSEVSTVFDRFFISELIYSEELGRDCGLTNNEIATLEQYLLFNNVKVIFVVATSDEEIEMIKSRLKPEDVWLREHIKSLNDRYKKYANNLAKAGINVKMFSVKYLEVLK